MPDDLRLEFQEQSFTVLYTVFTLKVKTKDKNILQYTKSNSVTKPVIKSTTKLHNLILDQKGGMTKFVFEM